MADAGSIWVNLRLKADDFIFGIDKARYKLTEWRDATNEGTKNMAKWGAALTATIGPAIAAGTAVYALQQKYGSMANTVLDMSAATGIGVEKIQQLQRTAVLSDTAFGTVEMGINRLTLAMDKARDSTSAEAAAFAKLGVNPSGKSPDQVLDETATALMGMQDVTQRNSIAMDIYGKSWSELIPFMETYIEKKEEIQKSTTFSKQELQDLKDAKAAWDDLANSVTIYTGKALVQVQQGTDLLLKTDAAFRKLGAGDVAGFIDAAADYRTERIRKEMEKAQQVIADNNKSSAGGWAPETGNSWAYDLFGVSGETAGAAKSVTDYMDAISEAMKKQKTATDDLTAAREKLADIDKDYQRQLSVLNPRDVSAARDLITRHKWAVEDQQAAIGKAQGKVAEAAAGVGKAGGDLVIYINDKLAHREPGVVSVAGERSLTQAGY